MPAFLLWLCCLALPLGAQTLPTRLATPKEIRDMLVQRIDVQHKAGAIVVGVVTKHGQEIISYGKFDSADPRVPDGETIFEIGSVTKVFTALLLSDMALRGEVNLNDPVSKYLPATVNAPTRNGKPITLLDLATHYSGLPRMPNGYNPEYSVEQMYDFLSHYTLTRDPGAKYEYSNFGAGLLGQLLAVRAGTDYETLLRDRITEPLGMKHTAMQLTPEMKADLISGFGSSGIKAPSIEVSAMKGAGAIRSNASDMLIFLAANMGLIQTRLQPAMKKMLSVHRAVSPGVQIAMGWHIDNGIVCHNGGTFGYHAYVGFEPRRKVGVVVLSNSTEFTDDLGRRVLEYPMEAPVEQQVRPPGMVP
jgi:CubicO group peptidase (beta-lactamase class C family)